MKKLWFVVVAFVLLVGCNDQKSGPSGSDESADTVYRNGRIYTVNEAQPFAEAVAIKDGKFVLVGSNLDAEDITGESTEVVDLRGQFVMPGIGSVW